VQLFDSPASATDIPNAIGSQGTEARVLEYNPSLEINRISEMPIDINLHVISGASCDTLVLYDDGTYAEFSFLYLDIQCNLRCTTVPPSATCRLCSWLMLPGSSPTLSPCEPSLIRFVVLARSAYAG